MFDLTILRILILCEPLLCLARPQYFCCLPCPFTNDCENPYYREAPLQPGNGLQPGGIIGGRGNGEGVFSPQMPLPPLPGYPRPKDPRIHGHGPDPNGINLTIKCNGEREAYEDPYIKAADWFRAELPDGNFCWYLQCNDPSQNSANGPPSSQQTPLPPTQPPQLPPTQPPSQNRPPQENPYDDPRRRTDYESRKRPTFFTNLFSLPGQLVDSVLGGTLELN